MRGVAEYRAEYGRLVDPGDPGPLAGPPVSAQPSETDRGPVSVRWFDPELGALEIEFQKQRWRYTRERTSDQMIAMADYFRARLGFASDQEMAEALGVHPARLAGWKLGADVPDPQNAQLLSRLAVVVGELREFLDPDVVSDWLLTEQYTLGGRTPMRALKEGMLAEVLNTANAAEHGAYI